MMMRWKEMEFSENDEGSKKAETNSKEQVAEVTPLRWQIREPLRVLA